MLTLVKNLCLLALINLCLFFSISAQITIQTSFSPNNPQVGDHPVFTITGFADEPVSDDTLSLFYPDTIQIDPNAGYNATGYEGNFYFDGNAEIDFVDIDTFNRVITVALDRTANDSVQGNDFAMTLTILDGGIIRIDDDLTGRIGKGSAPISTWVYDPAAQTVKLTDAQGEIGVVHVFTLSGRHVLTTTPDRGIFRLKAQPSGCYVIWYSLKEMGVKPRVCKIVK